MPVLSSRVLIAASAAILLLAFGGWWFFLRGDTPPPVSLGDAVASAAATAATTATGTIEATPTLDDDGLEGAWVVAEDSFVGYRIDEELARIGTATAVGRTSSVSGMLVFEDGAITSVTVTADVTRLESDDSRRDNQLRRQALETDQFPEASFVLAEPIAVDGDPADGEVITETAVGDLTLHGVTQRVELPLEGQLAGDTVVVVGSTVVRLADYDIDEPTAMSVLSVAEEATIELQLVFRKT